MPSTYKNILIVLLVAVVGYLLYLEFRPNPGTGHAADVQHKYDSVFAVLVKMRADSAIKLHNDSVVIMAARKHDDSLTTKLAVAQAQTKTSQANGAYYRLKWIEATGANDIPAERVACGRIADALDSTNQAINIERAIYTEQLKTKDIIIETTTSSLVTTQSLLAKSDSVANSEHAHGQAVTQDNIKLEKKVGKQSTLIKILAGGLLITGGVIYLLAK